MGFPASRVTASITGTIYYVSPSGNDSNPGTLSQPFRTLSRAHTAVSAGGAVYARGGTYDLGTSNFEITKSGTEGNMINFLAYPGETPILDGTASTSITTFGALLKLTGNYIMVSGFEVRNSRGMGVILIGHHNVAQDIYSHHNQANGILGQGDWSIIEFCRVYRCVLRNELHASTNWDTGISAARDAVNGVTDNAIIRSNTVWENWGEGISSFQATNTIIEDNITHDNFETQIYISDSTGVICRRNFAYMNPASYVYASDGAKNGILMGDEMHAPSSDNNIVVDNIVYGCRRNIYWWGGVNGGKLTNTTIANNTLLNAIYSAAIQINAASDGTQSTGPHANTVVSSNLVIQDNTIPVTLYAGTAGVTWDYNGWSKASPANTQGAHDVVGDPILVKSGTQFDDPWTSSYYKLASNSPMIGKGQVISAAQFDYYREARDAAPDIGAFEYIPAAPPPPPPPPPPGTTPPPVQVCPGNTVGRLLLRVAQRLRPVYYGTATSGDYGQMTDTTRTESDGVFNGGTIFFLSGDLAGFTAPITSYNGTTKTFLFPAQFAIVGPGTEYAVIDKKYKRGDLVAALNLALDELGPYTQIDTTLTTVLNQESYTLPTGVSNVVRVEIATETAAPYEWEEPYRYWKEQNGALYLSDNYLPAVAGRTMRVYYNAYHGRVSADCDTVTDAVDQELVATLAALHAARLRAGVGGSSDPEPGQLIQILTPQYVTLRVQRPVRRLTRDARWPGEIPPPYRW